MKKASLIHIRFNLITVQGHVSCFDGPASLLLCTVHMLKSDNVKQIVPNVGVLLLITPLKLRIFYIYINFIGYVFFLNIIIEHFINILIIKNNVGLFERERLIYLKCFVLTFVLV